MNQILQILINITLVVIIPLTIAISFIEFTKNRNIGFALLLLIVPISNKIRNYLSMSRKVNDISNVIAGILVIIFLALSVKYNWAGYKNKSN